MIVYSLLFLFTHESNRSFLQLFLQSLASFLATTTSTHALRAKILSFRFLDQFYNALPVHMGTERNGTIAYRSTFRITFFVVPFLEHIDVI